MRLSSTYHEGERIPDKYANHGVDGGANISPPFAWEGTGPEAKSFALAIVDHHPVAAEFVHWAVINIPSGCSAVEEGASLSHRMPSGAVELNTTYGTPGYGGPRPPAGTGNHPYETVVYALDVERLEIGPSAPLAEFFAAIKIHSVDQAALTGVFSR